MPTFQAPSVQDVPPLSHDYTADDPRTGENVTRLGRKFYAHYARGTRTPNVYILTDGTVTEETPQTTYTAEGVVAQEATSRIRRVFYGGRGPESVNAEEQALLEAAGYTVDA